METKTFEEVVNLALKLSPRDKAQLMERLAATLKQDLAAEPEEVPKSLYGLWKNYGVSISEDDIDAARREMWKNFPREDV